MCVCCVWYLAAWMSSTHIIHSHYTLTSSTDIIYSHHLRICLSVHTPICLFIKDTGYCRAVAHTTLKPAGQHTCGPRHTTSTATTAIISHYPYGESAVHVCVVQYCFSSRVVYSRIVYSGIVYSRLCTVELCTVELCTVECVYNAYVPTNCVNPTHPCSTHTHTHTNSHPFLYTA